MKIKIISLSDVTYEYTGHISRFNGQETAKLTSELRCTVLIDGNRMDIVVPVGFETDFGTVPKFAQCIVQARGKADRAFIVHDWLCVTLRVSRLYGDTILFKLMRYLHTPIPQPTIAFIAVRVFYLVKTRMLLDSTTLYTDDSHNAK